MGTTIFATGDLVKVEDKDNCFGATLVGQVAGGNLDGTYNVNLPGGRGTAVYTSAEMTEA